MDYFRFRLRLKRHAIFILIGGYMITFLYLLSVTKTSNFPKEDLQNKTAAHEASTKTETIKDDSMIKDIAVLVLVCDRTTVTRILDQLLEYRPDSKLFPIIVSHDCGSNGESVKSKVKGKYGKKLTYLTHPNYEATLASIEDIPSHMKGYYLISAHYGWALNYTFYKLGLDNIIVVEDDLEISRDFFEYFGATLPLLYQDSSLWCVSAYNDNGKPDLIDLGSPELLFRTDFFPGLGWMLTKELWTELYKKWPNAFWDDWMRLPDQRQGRACIHPEISRTKTFGMDGVSNGQFFFEHLQTIKLNDAFIPFSSHDLSYLVKNTYDSAFFGRIKSSILVKSIEDLETAIQNSSNGLNSYRLIYGSQEEFEKLAEHIGIMSDFKSGVPRGGYQGVVPVIYKQHRLYLIPLYYIQ